MAKSFESIIAPLAKIKGKLQTYADEKGKEITNCTDLIHTLNTTIADAEAEKDKAYVVAKKLGDLLGE